jgi:Flp pilus assembly protein TadG
MTAPHAPLLRRLRREERGQALVEFALILPILLIMVLGIIDFGRAWNLQQTITQAAREAARAAAVDNQEVTTQAQVDSVAAATIAASSFDPALATVTVTGLKAGIGTTVEVRIQMPYRFGFLAPFVRLVATDNNAVMNLETYARFRNE